VKGIGAGKKAVRHFFPFSSRSERQKKQKRRGGGGNEGFVLAAILEGGHTVTQDWEREIGS